jgi:hypothetical protein
MSTPTSAAEASAPLWPTLHLLVLSTEQQASFQTALDTCLAHTQDAPQAWPVLRWRLGTGAIERLEPGQLKDRLTALTHTGRNVTVWHGEQALDRPALQRMLGKGWQQHWGRRLEWARTASPWKPLIERLDRPDEWVVRQWLAGTEATDPHWPGLPAEHHDTGTQAHRQWYETHLRDLHQQWCDGWASAEQEANAATPATHTSAAQASAPTTAAFTGPIWQGSWLAEVGDANLSAQRGDAANQAAYRVSAAPKSTPSTEKRRFSAVLSPTTQAQYWVGGALKHPLSLATDRPAITLIYDPQNRTCSVDVKFPQGSNCLGRWLLWFYPTQDWPIPMHFDIDKEKQYIGSPAWPGGFPPPIDALVQGRFSLEQLPPAAPATTP